MGVESLKSIEIELKNTKEKPSTAVFTFDVEEEFECRVYHGNNYITKVFLTKETHREELGLSVYANKKLTFKVCPVSLHNDSQPHDGYTYELDIPRPVTARQKRPPGFNNNKIDGHIR